MNRLAAAWAALLGRPTFHELELEAANDLLKRAIREGVEPRELGQLVAILGP